MRLVICDDSIGFPALVRAWLKPEPGIEVVGTAKSGGEALTMVGELQPDVLLLDLLLPDVPDPAPLVRRLRAAAPDMRIVLVSSMHVRELEHAGRNAGVDAVCGKGSTDQELIGTIRGVMSRRGTEA
jgi:two-component system OmpR family response regulator